jgi:hypothetical protein
MELEKVGAEEATTLRLLAHGMVSQLDVLSHGMESQLFPAKVLQYDLTAGSMAED